MKKILVTGATGLLGKQIVNRLLQSGYDISILIRNLEKLPCEWQAKVNTIECDILDTPTLMERMVDFDTVIHAAAMISFNPRDKEMLAKTNVEGTSNLINTSLTNGVSNFIYISSVAALGKPENPFEQNIITETQQWQSSPYNSYYGITKFHGECEVRRGEAEGMRVAIISPSIILGEGDWKNGSSRIFKYIYDEKPFITNGYVNCVDVQDVSTMVEKILDQEKWGEKFICNGSKVSFEELFEKIATRFGKKKPNLKLSTFLIEILWRIELLRSLLFRTDPLITKETAITSRSNIYFNPKKSITMLGQDYTPLETTLDRICKFYS